jgi:BASS family bile acid:Na+ symporter
MISPQAVIGFALKGSILLTVFGFGLEATRQDLLYLVQRPRVLLRSLIAMFVIMPLFAVFLTREGSLIRPVMIALVALSISPVPPLLPKRVTKSGGRTSYGLGLMVTAATLSIAVVPLAAYLLGKYFHRPFAMGPAAVAKLILPSVLLPVAAGILVRRLLPAIAHRIAKPVARIGGIVLLLGVLCILVFAMPTIWSLIGNGTILAFIAFIIVGIAAGHFLGGHDPDERVTLALSTACRHPALAVAIATANFAGEHKVFASVLLYAILNVVIVVPYISWQRRKTRAPRVVAQQS